MEWTKQSEEMFSAWMGTQKKMWDNWLDMVQKSAPESPATELWQKTLDTWEQTVNKALEAQTEWTKMWAENIPSAAALPKEFADWAQQARDMNQRWVELQQQLWSVWFGLAKKSEPANMVGSWDQESQKMAHMWQESVGKIMEAQMEWARSITGENKSAGIH